MKKILFVIAVAVVLTSCGAEKEPPKLFEEEVAIEKPLAVVIRQHITGSPVIEYKDTFFKYTVDLNYIGEDVNRNTSEIFPACPVASAKYTVVEKSSGIFVKDELVPQMPCSRCHPRR